MNLLFIWLAFFALNGSSSVQREGDRQTSSANKEWFQKTQQELMDAIAVGNKGVWDRVLDENCIYTSEEGEVLTKKDLLKDFNGLPPGLTGNIKVEDLTVQEFTEFAIVRFSANEHEDVFGQELQTKYRVTNTFRRSGNEWKLLASHTSVVTSDPPPQKVPKEKWPSLVGVYQLRPNGWKLHVVFRDGELFAGRDPNKLRALIPLGSNVFVRKGLLGELIFVTEQGDPKASRIVDFRKFEPLIWTRVSEQD